MKSNGIIMKEQFKINPLGAEVMSMKRKKSKNSKTCTVWFLAGIATMSLCMVVVFWHTNVFRDAVLSALEIKNGTQTYTWWERPPVSPLLRVRIFNYTNVDEYRSGKASKLKVEEIGPYVYRETVTRVNVKFHENGTLTYRENITHVWVEGNQNDLIYVPNIPLILAVKKVGAVNSFFHPLATGGFGLFGAHPFKLLTVKEYLWGYSDNLLEVGISIWSITEDLPFKKFGMLVSRSGLTDELTMHTGTDDINNLGKIVSLNGMNRRNVWHDKNCDEIEGTDGSMFPPNLIRDKNASLDIYAKEICRKLSLRFHDSGSSFDIPSLRYKLSDDTFVSSNTTNSCFCQKNSGYDYQEILNCPSYGTFDMSACSMGVPLVMSFPHFYKADKSLLNQFNGLKPSKELHETYADLHPRLGILMGGWSRFQINVRASVPGTLSTVLSPLKEGMILPVIWFEIGIDELPETVLETLRQSYFTVNTVESTLQWGSLLITILSMCAMAYVMKKHRDMRIPKWQNTFSLQTGC